MRYRSGPFHAASGRSIFPIMDPTRRYSEEEIAQILDDATQTQTDTGPSLLSGHGMTLAELQEIGLEVGIAADLISQAAARLDIPPPSSSPNVDFLGTPIGVGRTVHLDRPLTDNEWNRLVVDLRETFDARGRLREEGSFRHWYNGNLQALLEPTDSGERLRLKTLRGSASARLGLGALAMGASAIALIVAVVAGAPSLRDLLPPILAGLAGGSLFTYARLQLPRWAATRERQMEGVAARVLAIVKKADQPTLGTPPSSRGEEPTAPED